MRVTNGQIWEAREALRLLVKEPWPVNTAYALAKLARKMGERVRDIEAVQTRLVMQYGAPSGPGRVSVAQDSDNWPAFAEQFGEMLAIEEDFCLDAKIVLPDLSDSAVPEERRPMVTPEMLLALDPFVTVAE